jgi:hypothetical protein
VGTPADVPAQVDLPHERAIEHVSFKRRAARDTATRVVPAAVFAFEHDFIFAVAIKIAYGGVVGDTSPGLKWDREVLPDRGIGRECEWSTGRLFPAIEHWPNRVRQRLREIHAAILVAGRLGSRFKIVFFMRLPLLDQSLLDQRFVQRNTQAIARRDGQVSVGDGVWRSDQVVFPAHIR